MNTLPRGQWDELDRVVPASYCTPPARIVRSERRLRLRIQHDWPWGKELVAAFARLWALPPPAV
jgi:hypothetical protein